MTDAYRKEEAKGIGDNNYTGRRSSSSSSGIGNKGDDDEEEDDDKRLVQQGGGGGKLAALRSSPRETVALEVDANNALVAWRHLLLERTGTGREG